MGNYDFVIVTENKARVDWLANSLKERGFSVLVGDVSSINPNSINVLFYYSKILSSTFLSTLSDSVLLNLHNSLLPNYRGLHAFSWAIEFGEIDLGYTLHEVSAQVDAGEVLAQIQFGLAPDCDVNCAFRIGQRILEKWLPDTLEELNRHGLPRYSDRHLSVKNLGEIFKRRSGPYELTTPFDTKRLRNALRASNPPYGQGLVFNRNDSLRKIYLLPFSNECWGWVQSQNSELLVESVRCTDGELDVNSIFVSSARQINS